jgi:heat shock protein HslJ
MEKPRKRGAPLAWASPVVLLALGTALAGCGDGAAAGGPDLEGKTFVSTEVAGHDVAAGSEVQVVFQTDRISVHAGCNTFSGESTWQDGVLVVTQPVARTMMACTDDLERQDRWIETFLASEPALRLDGRMLVLGDSEAGLTLEEQ